MTASSPSLRTEYDNTPPPVERNSHSSDFRVNGNLNLSIAEKVEQVLCTEGAESLAPQIISPAKNEHLPRILGIRKVCSEQVTPRGVPFIKHLTSHEIEALLPTTLVLLSGEEVMGTIYFYPLEGHEGTAVIGGFCVAKEYQSLGLGRLLLEKVLQKIRDAGFTNALSITANDPVKRLFLAFGGIDTSHAFRDVLMKAQQRYGEDAGLVQIFHFPLRSAEVFCAQSHA